MRLLVLASADEIHTVRWVSYFRKRGHEVLLATVEPSNGKAPVPERVLSAGASRIKALRYLLAAPAVARIVKEFKPQVVNAHFVPGYGFITALVSEARPLAITIWGSDLLINPHRSPLHRLRARFALHRAALVTCDAAVIAEVLTEFGVESSRILQVPMGIDPRVFHPPKGKHSPVGTREGKDSLGFRVISTRRLEPLYDVETLLRAAVILRESGWNFEVEIAGEGSQRKNLEAFSQEYGLGKRVHFRGELQQVELARCLQQADIYVSTSHSDGTSVSLLEAMATGLFPVVTSIRGNREWIENGRNGLTFPPGDFASLSASLAQAFQQPELREKAREINLEIIRKKALWEDNMRVVEERFRRLAGE